MFSQYAADGTLDDQYQDNDADLSGAPAADAAPAADPAAVGAGVGAIPTGTAQELAKMIVDTGNVTGDSRYMKQITDIANGGTGCFVSPDILGFLAAMSKTHKLFISSLNRRCTGVLTASGTGSLHYAGQGGRAVDVSIFDGTSMGNSISTSSYDSPRAKAAATAYFNEAVKILPKNAELGQINSCGLTVNTAGFSDIVTDTCNHAHVGIP